MMTPSSSLHRPPSTPAAAAALRHGTPLHPPSTPILPPHHTPIAQFPSTPRQHTWTTGGAAAIMNSPRPSSSSQWQQVSASSRGVGAVVATPTSSSLHKSSAEWAAMAQQWASRGQAATTPRQTPSTTGTRQSPYHGAGDATPLIDET